MCIKKKSNNTFYVKSSNHKTDFNRIVVQKVKSKVHDLFNFNFNRPGISAKTGGINEIRD